jgi:hypothetical protein
MKKANGTLIALSTSQREQARVVVMGTIDMKLSFIFSGALLIAGLAISSAPANATPSVCPAAGFATGCNLVITFNADGSIVTTVGSFPGTYDGSDDTLVGVVNNTAGAITSINLSGSNIFGFEGDGIDTFTHVGPVAGNPDTSGYGGPDAYFTSTDNSNGTVYFANGGIASGQSDYFSIEEAVTVEGLAVTAAPEPASMALLGVGMFGAGIVRRFRRQA